MDDDDRFTVRDIVTFCLFVAVMYAVMIIRSLWKKE